jgi:hypothetical protein
VRPFFLVSLGDAEDTELYVSARSGEIVLDTTRTERIWNWLGSIPRWIYPTVLRQDGPLWRQVVLRVAGICMLVAGSGIWIGILRVRLRRRYSGGRITPYRGWMAWHHVTGSFAGVFVLTWMFSGWLSLDPGAFFSGRGPSREMVLRYAGHDAPTMAAEFLSRPRIAAVEARFVWLGGKPLMLLADRSGRQTSADPATGIAAPLSDAMIFAAARQLMPQAAMTMHRRLGQYDAYWYAHHQQRALPVLRAGFDDAAQTWFHIDPHSGEILGRTDSGRRSYRWLFNALHSFDFPLLLAWRPAWDIVLWLLSLLGLTISVGGIVIGWRADFYSVALARSARLALCRFCGMLISNALRSATALWNCSSAILKAVNAPSSMAPCSKHCSVSRRISSASVCIWSSSSVESLRRAALSMSSNRSRNELLLLRSSFFR